MKKQSTKKRPNLMQFTLSDMSLKIIEQFSTKYGTSKSYIIDRALQLLAAQYHRKVIISYELLPEDFTTTTTKKVYIPEVKPLKNDHYSNYNEEVMTDEEMQLMLDRIEARKKALRG